MSGEWRRERRQDFGWSVEGERDIKAFWLPEVALVGSESSTSGYLGAGTAGILRSKIAGYSAEITVSDDFIAALSRGRSVKAFRVSTELGGGYLIVLPASA